MRGIPQMISGTHRKYDVSNAVRQTIHSIVGMIHIRIERLLSFVTTIDVKAEEEEQTTTTNLHVYVSTIDNDL
jgi:hypothetical protein